LVLSKTIFKFDQLNLMDRQLSLPAIKHKWIARLIEQKKRKFSLDRKKKELKEEVLKTLEKGGIPTGIHKAALDKKVDSSDAIQKINQDLEDTQILVEYLEKVEKVFSSFTYDIKNVIEINRQELS
jgi:hypothetical protein